MPRTVQHLMTFCMFALALSPIACASDTTSARAFVEDLYAPYADDGSSPEPLGADAPAIFASPLLALIRSDQQRAGGEVGLLDHDPICGCQDFKNLRINDLRFKQLDSQRLHATVTLVNMGKLTSVGFVLVEESAGWRIADVEEPGVPSLARYLASGLAKARSSADTAPQN